MEYISYTQIVQQLNITKGDILLVSSDIQKIALSATKNKERFSASKFIDTLMDAVGPSGTLLFPTYNWDFCKGIPFDYYQTACTTGALGKEALKRKDFFRTAHPIYSFAVWGKDQELLCSMTNISAFGSDSPFAYLHKNGKNLIIDVSFKNCFTFTHYVEESIGVSYRYLKTFSAPYIDKNHISKNAHYSMYVRDLEKEVENIIDPIADDLKQQNKLQQKTINNSLFSILRFDDAYNCISMDIRNNHAHKLVCYIGQETDVSYSMYQLATDLFPICRSITGDGVRTTLKKLQAMVPALQIHEVPSGSEVFDWTVPEEWNIKDAYIEDLTGERILSFQDNNLHVMGYSQPISKVVSRDELLSMIYIQEDRPNAIPYVTSYYAPNSGFCMSKVQKDSLNKERYYIKIDSELKQGSLTYGEIFLPGDTEKEIFISTYVCHPSMANNEVSGPTVAVHLAKWLTSFQHRYTYRFIFVPETIGAITYLSKHLQTLKKNVIAGYVLSCVGDDREYSYIQSRYGDTFADKILKNVLTYNVSEYKTYSYLERGSDERQYSAPNIDLPVCTFCRSKFGMYPEYHTSDDNMDIISPRGLNGAYEIMQICINSLECNDYFQTTCLCEPQLGKRGLYPNISKKGSATYVEDMCNVLAYADGRNDLFDLSNILNVSTKKLIPIIQTLEEHGLIKGEL